MKISQEKIDEIKRYFEMTRLYFRMESDAGFIVQLGLLEKSVIDSLQT